MALAPDTVALSEPPPVEDVLAGGGSADDLRSLLDDLGGAAPRAVLKLDSWALHDLDVVRAALPGVPVALLVREPAAVLASHAALPGMQMIPGALGERRVRVAAAIATADDILDYRARVLAALYDRAAAERDVFALVCDYRDLVPAGLAKMAEAFGLAPLPEDGARRAAHPRRQAPRLPLRGTGSPGHGRGRRRRRALGGRAISAGDGWGSSVPDRVRLRLDFDPAPLVADMDALDAAEWIPHFNTQLYTGEWSGVALRSVGGKPGTLYPDTRRASAYADTPALARLPRAPRRARALRVPA